MPLPKFTITEVFKPGRMNSNCILVIMAIATIAFTIPGMHFTSHLDIRRKSIVPGLMPEEFIWETYAAQPGAPKNANTAFEVPE